MFFFPSCNDMVLAVPSRFLLFWKGEDQGDTTDNDDTSKLSGPNRAPFFDGFLCINKWQFLCV